MSANYKYAALCLACTITGMLGVTFAAIHAMDREAERMEEAIRTAYQNGRNDHAREVGEALPDLAACLMGGK